MELAAGGAGLAPIRSAAELTRAVKDERCLAAGLGETPHPTSACRSFPGPGIGRCGAADAQASRAAACTTPMQDVRDAVQASRGAGAVGAEPP